MGSGWLVEKGGQDLWRGLPQSGQSPKHQVPLPHDCREHGIAPYENLADLNQLIARWFTFVGFPLRIRNGTGSPVRAVAVLAE